ncbi:MAG: hypothetical protein AB1Z65_06860 [Candidatus Sulfomarinibacteraceae bacterium]
MQEDHSFARWLLDQGVLSKADLRRARDAQRGRMGRLDTEIIDLKLLSESRTLELLGKFHRTRTVSGAELEYASLDALRMLTPRIATRLGVVPFRLEGRTLSVATLDPGDLLVEDEIAQLTGCMVASFVTLEVRFVEALNRHFQTPITARYAGLIRRLAGAKEQPTAAVVPEEFHQDREPAPAGSEDRPTPAERRSSRARTVENEALELSADELSLFPSLRAEETPQAPSTEPPARTDAAPAARKESGPIPIPPEAVELSPETLLQAAAHAMQNVEMRDDIADAVLGFCAPLFRRRMMLVLRKDTVMGWRGEGFGVDESAVKAISVPTGEPSVFSGLLQGVDFWLGPLPTMPRNSDIVSALGGEPPKDCYVLPVKVRDRVVCFLYGDNMGEGVGGLPLAELKRLAAKAGLAFQVYLLKGKIRQI